MRGCWGIGEGDWFFVDEDHIVSLDRKTRNLKVGMPAAVRWYSNRGLRAAETESGGTRLKLSLQ